MIKINIEKQNKSSYEYDWASCYSYSMIGKLLEIRFKNFKIRCCPEFIDWFNFDKDIGLYLFGVYKR